MLRLNHFDYWEPSSLDEARDMLAQGGSDARLLAGGTDLLVRLKRGMITAKILVNLKRIPGLDGISYQPDGTAQIGALTRVSAIESSSQIQAGHPVLAQAASLLGSPPIRNLATIGGNVGRASPASDLVPAMIVLGAQGWVYGANGPQKVLVEDMCLRPGCTILASDELITGFTLPPVPPRSGGAYLKYGRTKGMDLAMVGAAVRLTLDESGERATQARVALSSVAPVPLLAPKAAEMLCRGPIDDQLVEQVADQAAREASPCCDLRCSDWYRTELIRVLVCRAVKQAVGQALK